MTAKALNRLLAASLVFFAAVLASIAGKAQSPAPTADWVNIKDPKFGARGDGNHDDTAAIQAAIDYAFAHNRRAVYCPVGNYKTAKTIYLDPPGNLRSNLSAPTMFAFSMSFFGDPAAGGNYQGCQIRPTFNNGIAFLVGTGQGMRVSDIAVIGPAGGYRGGQSNAGVGIGLSGGNGGSSINLVENTYVANFYALYKTDANNACCLNDSNTFRKVSGDNGYYGVQFYGTQTDINDVVEPRISATIAIDSELSRPVIVIGGNLSAEDGQSGSFGLSGVSAFSKVSDGNGFDYSFTATVASPDQYIGSVYNSYTVRTAHFGVIPLTMTAWNAATGTATFRIWTPWAFANYGTMDLTTGTGIQAEIAAATTLYAAERVAVAQGMGISLDGVHIENPNTCTSLFIAAAGWAGATTNEVKNPYFNYDPSLAGSGNVPAFYCQQTFPFVAGNGGSLSLKGGTYGTAAPVIVETGPVFNVVGSQLAGLKLNIRVYDSGGYAYGPAVSYGQFANEQRGTGLWDNDYFLPASWSSYHQSATWVTIGELASPYCGFEPCPWTTPDLSPSIYASVSGALGAVGSYPPIACRTVFKSVDWNSGVLARGFLRSASCPGYSWGQSFTDATIGETVTWSYMGQSDTLYLDAKSLGWMFPGLGISLDNGSGAVPYIVTGVYPQLGYVTVSYSGNNYPSDGPLAGTSGTVYSCSSGCTIFQAPFSWSAY